MRSTCCAASCCNPPTGDAVRLFIAVEIDEAVRKRLAEVQRKLRYVNANVSWVAPRNFHFTLKYLGETEEEKIAPIRNAMQAVTSEFVPMECDLVGIGQFPRVIWAGLEGDVKPLIVMASRLDEELHKLGFPRENREFTPHLTFGRIKYVGDREGLTRLVSSLKNEAFGAVRVEAIHLFQSTLNPQGSIYTKLFTAQLKGTDHGTQS